MGSRRDFPWRCLRLFVPAKIRTVDGHGEIDSHAGWMARGLGGIYIQNTKLCDTTVTTKIVGKGELI